MTAKKTTLPVPVKTVTKNLVPNDREVWVENQLRIAEALRKDAEAMMRRASSRFTEAERRMKYTDFIVISSLLITVGVITLFVATKAH